MWVLLGRNFPMSKAFYFREEWLGVGGWWRLPTSEKACSVKTVNVSAVPSNQEIPIVIASMYLALACEQVSTITV